MTKTVDITFSVDETVKQGFEKRLNQLGIDIQTAMNAFMVHSLLLDEPILKSTLQSNSVNASDRLSEKVKAFQEISRLIEESADETVIDLPLRTKSYRTPEYLEGQPI